MHRILFPVAFGTILGLIIDQIMLRHWPGFETFEHEVTHAIVALFCLRKIRRFVVTRHGGGYVEHQGSFGGLLAEDLIGFAPYILPTFTVISVLFRPWVDLPYRPWFDGWIGFTLGFHTWSTLRETKEAWTHRAFAAAGTGETMKSDLGRRGLIFSSIYIATTTTAIHGLVLALILGGYGGFGMWYRTVKPAVKTHATWAVARVTGLLR